jgi:hypothetical protein
MDLNKSPRRSAGHRHNVRDMTEAEKTRLLELRQKTTDSLDEFNGYIVKLYDSFVSQQHIADVLHLTQGAVHLKIRRHCEKTNKQQPPI